MTDKEKFEALLYELGIEYYGVKGWYDNRDSVLIDSKLLDDSICGAELRIEFNDDGTFKNFVTFGE